MSNETVFVKILDKDYQVACPPEEREALLQSAKVLDERMRAVKQSGSVIGLERIAVMAALNLSHELLLAKGSSSTDADSQALERLDEKLERSLERYEEK